MVGRKVMLCETAGLLVCFYFPNSAVNRGELREIVFGTRSSAGRSPAVTRIDHVDVNTIAVAAIYSIVDRFMNFTFNLCHVETSAVQDRAMHFRENEQDDKKQRMFNNLTLLN
jgi:hypothetical protein